MGSISENFENLNPQDKQAVKRKETMSSYLLYVDKELYRQMKIRVATLDTNMRAYLTDLIRKNLNSK